MRVDVVTLFPEIFSGYLSESLLCKAIQKELISVHLHNLRDWSKDKHHKVDDRPYGGGPGMLIRAEPVVDCVEAIQLQAVPGKVFLMSPQGTVLNQSLVQQIQQLPRIILVCGRYEGFDQRIIDILQPSEISLGDFILNGGEVAAMAIIDSVMRLIPGALGDERSSQQDSFSHPDELEFPQYTRPRVFRGLEVPEVLVNGNHQSIAQWREQQSRARSLARRIGQTGSNDKNTND